MLFAFISYKDQFTQRVLGLIDKTFELYMLRLHGERVADIILAKPETNEVDDQAEGDLNYSRIEFRNVKFKYSEGERYVINGVSIKIPDGQCVALTGASGCGKTTLVKLLLGLLEPTEGEILIGGLRLTGIGLQNYRKIVASVMQVDTLFAGSIQENIAFFDPEPNLERILICAKKAAIHSEITSMPMGYHTLIGDIGSGLSGGGAITTDYACPRLV